MNNKKKTIILVVAIVLVSLTIGGIFYWWFFPRNNESSVGNGSFLPFGEGADQNTDFQYFFIDEEFPALSYVHNDTGTRKNFRMIFSDPSAGAIATNSFTRIVDRATGHIFEYNYREDTLSRLTNTTMPAIQEALWTSDGRTVFLRYLTDAGIIKTYRLTLLDTPCVEFNRTLRVGSTGPDVRQLQQFLNKYDDTKIAATGAGSPGNETTTFGPGTARAVEIFQESHNLPVTGIVDAETAGAMNQICKQERTESVLTQGAFLPDNISTLSISPAGNRVFYLENRGGGAVGIIAPVNGGSPQTVFQNPIQEWEVSWINENTLLFTTKASDSSLGYAYSFTIGDGDMQRVVGGLFGLATYTKNGVILYSGQRPSQPGSRTEGQTGLIEAGSKTTLATNNVRIVPEKCVSTNDRQFYCGVSLGDFSLDDWYMGISSFTDMLALTSVEENGLALLDVFTDSENSSIDIIHPTLSPNGQHLTFINKKDQSVWLLDTVDSETEF